MRQPSLSPLCYVFTSQLDLSGNTLCGINHYTGAGTYTAEGINAIADALKGNASVTSVSLLANRFDDETVAMLLKLKEEKPNLITLCGFKPDQAELAAGGLTPQDAKLLAPEILVHASVTKISLTRNEIDEEGTKVICESLKANQTLKELDLSGTAFGESNIGGPAGAKHVADMLRANASVTSVWTPAHQP